MVQFRGTNFLEIFQKKKRARKRFFLFVRILLYIFAVVTISSLILICYYFNVLKNVYNLAHSGKRNLELASEQIKDLDFEKASFYLRDAENNFELAKIYFENLFFLKKIPWAKDQFQAISNLLVTGTNTASALHEVVLVAKEIVEATRETGALIEEIGLPKKEITFAQLTTDQKRVILQKLYDSRPRLLNAQNKIDLALSALTSIEKERLVSQILDVLESTRQNLLQIKDTVNLMIPLAEIVPPIAGYPEIKTYLFLLQNSDEMRPTGGFIGTYGIVKMRYGEIEMFETYNIYALDGPAEKFLKEEPPAPIKKYLKVPYWFMRDSNWSPDFPTSAAKAEWFYHAERGPEQKIDAVIAVTPTFIEDILRQIGSVELNGEIFTPDNLMEVLQYKVEKEYYEKGIPEIRRKDIVGDLGKKIFEQLANLPSSRWSNIFETVKKNLKEKHILIWSKDSTLQSLFLREDWTGKIKTFDGDYLMVVDANLASLKTDSVMDKKISYSFSRGHDGKLHARVDINYKNKGTFTWKTTRYRTYTRIYVPEGSTLVKGVGMMENDKISDPLRLPGKVDVGKEFGKTYFGAFIAIEPGEERTLSFEYILPEKIQNQIEGGSYKLLVQKQSGTIAHPLTLNLNFGKKIKRAGPSEEPKEWGDEIYKLRTDLRVDREIEVGF